MKINQIIVSESSVGTSTAGGFATVAKPLGEVQKRTNVHGLAPIANLAKAKKKGPYANSLISEGRVKELSMDLSGKDALTDTQFKEKYGKTKAEMRKMMREKPPKKGENVEKVDEAKLDEDDLIIVPGQGKKIKSGFIPQGKSRIDHEVGMAKSDLLQILKNTEIVMMAIKNRTEEEGLEGWVQEKIIKAADYMNTIAEYLEGKEMSEMTGGVIAGGGVGEGELTAWQKLQQQNKKNDPTRIPRGYELTAHGKLVKKSKNEKPNQGVGGHGQGMVEGLAKGQAAWKKEMIDKGAVRFWRDRSGDGTIDRIIAYNDKGAVVGGFNRKGVSEEKINEKFKSKQQAKLMYATAGGADTGVSKKVAKEFIKKSHGQKVSKLPTKVKKG